MAAATYDLYIEQGSTFRVSLVYGHKDGTVDVDGNANVVPYDLTGCVARMQVRQRRASEVLISATTSNGGIVFDADPTTGKLTITITDEATNALSVSKARYDLEIGYPSGDVVRILQGKVTVDPNITQNADADNISDGLSDDGDINEQQVDVDSLVSSQPSTAGQ
jgi:hypothetical protein